MFSLCRPWPAPETSFNAPFPSGIVAIIFSACSLSRTVLVSPLSTRVPSPDRQALVEKFAHVARATGDRARGKKLYTTHCVQCHIIAGTGGAVGPPLDGIGARSRDDLLIAILDPNQSADGTYLMWVVETKDGRFASGRLGAETKVAIEILDIEGGRQVIQRADIASMESSPLSLMPATFESLGEAGLADLLEYLAGQIPAKKPAKTPKK